MVTYAGITAMYEVLITVTNTEHFGDLVDKILTLEGFIISKIEWKPDEVIIQSFRTKKRILLWLKVSKKARRCARIWDSHSRD